MSAPYFDINTPVPTWGGIVNNDRIKLEARGNGLLAGITPQTLIPHGETVAVLTSGYVKNSLVSSPNGYEGIGHSLQGFVKGPTGSPVRVYNNNIETNGDPSQWVNQVSTDYRRVTFIEQMPDNINPEWMQSVWFVKGVGGFIYLRNLEFRDHYSRVYRTSVSPATWTSFTMQTHQGFILQRGATVWGRYLETIVMRIAQGQPVTVNVRAYLERVGAYDLVGVRTPIWTGIALKMTRRDNGGIEWWNTVIGTPLTQDEITDEIIDKNSTFEAANAYSQVEILVWVMAVNRPATDLSSIYMIQDGIELDITVSDSMSTGSE